MLVARTPPEEAQRIKVLRSLKVLDAPLSEALRDIVELAQSLTRSSIAVVSLIDSDRQWFAARIGINVEQTPRDVAFCAHTILSDEPLWVEDASQDPRFWNNPLVVGPQSIRFYAGAPILVDGHKLGAVAAAGCIPRPYDAATARALSHLARIAAERLGARRANAAPQTLFAAARDAVVSMTDTGSVVAWNPAAERLFGLDASEARGRPFASLLADDFSAAFADAFSAQVAAEAESVAVPLDVIGRRPDGGEFPVELSLCAWSEAGERRVGAILRDTTRRLVAERALQRAKDQADAANRAKSEFLAVMSHEMRTPLNGVVAVADVLARTQLSPDQREMVEIVRSAGATLDSLLSDILDLARIESGAVELKPEAFDLHEAFTTTLKLWETKAREKDLAFTFETDLTGPLRVHADPLKVRQIFGNLVSNAIKFTDKGRVSVRLRRLDEAAPSTFELTVEDTGIGLNPEDEGRIFERFQQGDGGMTRRYGGTGLGLAISRELASLMGGRLACRGEEGKGSVFTLTLPLPVLEAVITAAPPGPHAAAPSRLGKRRVLLADDHPTNRKIVQLILSDPGVDLVAVENGAEAVERFKAEPFDMVLMDMQMPVMDGLAATRAIRELERAGGSRQTPLIMLTANAMPEHVEAARNAGANRHLTKPITAAGLISAMGELFDAVSGQAAAPVARRA